MTIQELNTRHEDYVMKVHKYLTYKLNYQAARSSSDFEKMVKAEKELIRVTKEEKQRIHSKQKEMF